MAQFEQFTYVDLSAGIRKVPVNGGIFSHDIKSHKLGVIVMNHGVPVELTGSILGIAKLPTGEKLEFPGVLDSTDTSKAYVELPESAYITGPLTVAIRNIDTNDNKIVLIAYTGYVDGATDGTPVVPPGTLPNDIDEFIAELAAIRSDVVGCENLNISQTKSGNTITVTTTDRTGTQTSNTISGFDSSGSYADMTVGNAEQLVATVGVEDKVPYLFRTSGGSADIGDREVDKIVGGTVAWNQLLENGNFANVSKWKTTPYTVSGNVATITAPSAENNILFYQTLGSLVYGHKYFMSCETKSSATINFGLCFGSNVVKSGTTASTWTTCATIANDVYDTQNVHFFRSPAGSGFAENDEINIRNCILVDLTQMFGSTIADYIYSLETANAGAGVAWFRKLFPRSYYAYNAGRLQSVQARSHVMTGFNQWDEVWEIGSINSSGENTSSTSVIRSKNYIPVLPNTTYYFYCGSVATNAFRIFWYDKDKNFLYRDTTSTITNGTATAPENGYYLRFWLTDYGTTYKNDICINFHWDGERSGEYEPYKSWSYPLDDSLTLRGIPKLDANNSLYYDGDEYASDGTVTRKYAEINLYDLSWTYQSPNCFFSAELTNAGVTNGGFICPKYEKNTGSISGFTSGMGKILNNRVYLGETTVTDAATFKTSLSGVYLVYELATPTTEQADPYQNPQIVDDWGTEEYVDAGVTATTPTRDVAIPVGHKTKYLVNLLEKLEYLPSLVNTDGKYAIQQTNGQMSLVAVPDELPTPPSSDGNYILTVTVNGSTKTYSWSKLS